MMPSLLSMIAPVQIAPFDGHLTLVEYVGMGFISLLSMTVAIGWTLFAAESNKKRNWFVIWLISIYFWVAPMIVEFIVPMPLWGKIFLYQLGKMSAYLVAPTFIIFVLYYTENSEYAKKTWVRGLAFGPPLLIIGIIGTNTWFHNLFWSGHHIEQYPFQRMVAERTTLFWVGFATTHIQFSSMWPVLLKYAYETGRKVRKQVATILVAASIGGSMAIAGHIGVGPLVPDLKYGAFTSAVSMSLVAFSLWRYQLFDLSPVARKTAWSSVRSGSITLDDNEKIVDYNDAALNIFPQIEGQQGEKLEEVVPELIDPEADRDATGAEKYVDTHTQYPGDDRRIYDVSVGEMENDNGENKGYVVVLTDDTERLEKAQDLEQQTEQLEQFAGIVSHDLRNPLSVAKGRLDELETQVEDADNIEQVVDMLGRMEDIIDDTLTLTREGQAIEERSLEELKPIADEAWEGSKGSKMDKTTFENNIEPGTKAYADGDRIRRALENLFRNSVDHGGTDVTVRIGRTEDGFYVEDDGPGIPEEKRDEVFEQGYTTGGTGLGLAIVEKIVEAHDWNIHATESESGGARFEFTDADLVNMKGDTEEQTGSSGVAAGD